MWQHVKLSEQICLRDTLSCCWDVNQPTNKNTVLFQEYAIHKRMGIKELQQSLMSEVIGQGKLRAEQADWLLKEHKKQQEAVHRMYDEEISRQRMVLEEKLARRRALAQASVSDLIVVVSVWSLFFFPSSSSF